MQNVNFNVNTLLRRIQNYDVSPSFHQYVSSRFNENLNFAIMHISNFLPAYTNWIHIPIRCAIIENVTSNLGYSETVINKYFIPKEYTDNNIIIGVYDYSFYGLTNLIQDDKISDRNLKKHYETDKFVSLLQNNVLQTHNHTTPTSFNVILQRALYLNEIKSSNSEIFLKIIKGYVYMDIYNRFKDQYTNANKSGIELNVDIDRYSNGSDILKEADEILEQLWYRSKEMHLALAGYMNMTNSDGFE